MTHRAARRTTSALGWLIAPALVLSLTGCPMGTYGSKVSPEQKAAIVKGRTSRADLLRELGNPDQTIDLGNGKEQLSYISEKITSYAVTSSSEGTEFWVVLKDGIVQDFGERPTTKQPSYLK